MPEQGSVHRQAGMPQFTVVPFQHMPAHPLEIDFLVIGAGVAGLRAAIELAPAGRVLALAKREVTDSSTASMKTRRS